MSRNKRSGFSSVAALTASNPLGHSATTLISGCRRRYSLISARAGASSSTTIAVNWLFSFIVGGLLRGREGQAHFGDEFAFLFASVELPRCAILRLQPL